MFSLSAPMIWLVLLVAFILLEIATVGLLTIWFAGGALAAFFVSVAQGGVAVQVIVFLIVSVVLIEPIDNLLSTGRVMIRGQEWAARSVDEKQKFKKDDVVSVVSISGVKLMVKCPE